MPEELLPLLLFAAAFLLRISGAVGSATLWHARARAFYEALLSGQLAGTYQAPHPGVSTMWLAGLARQVAILFNPDYDGLPVARRLNIELIPQAMVVSLAIVLAYLILKRLFDFQVAAFSALLLALDPYHISVSKVIHVDALVSSFMMLAALLLWLFLADGRRRWIFLSGVFAGLGLLTKTPALFLVPYFFLCMLVWQAGLYRRSDDYRLTDGLRAVLFLALLWLMALAATYFILWPAMWSAPRETVTLTIGGTDFYRRTPHEYPVLLLGRVTAADPGPLFYPVNMAIKTTAVSLIGFLLSFYVLLRGRLSTVQRQALFLGLAFVFFFVLMMTLGQKKLDTYMLPALQFVTILAGIGWVFTLRRLWGANRQALNICIAALLGIQVLLLAAFYPYYGAHYNYLLGGPKTILGNNVVAGQEFGFGLEQAADYLNTLPLPTERVVGAQDWLDFYHYFQGKTVPMTDDQVDYLVFTRNWTLRGVESGQWHELWDTYRGRDPKYVVAINGIDYVWIYKTGPLIEAGDISHPLSAVFGDQVRLLGYDFLPEQLHPGDTVRLTLYWEAVDTPAGDYTVFAHLLDEDGSMRGQHDGQPQGGMYPTHLWDRGERVRDVHEIQLDPEAPPGAYQFAVGLYTLESLQRLAVVMDGGQLLPDASVTLPSPRVLPSAAQD